MTVTMFAFSPAGIRNMDRLEEIWKKKEDGIRIRKAVKCRQDDRWEETPLSELVREAFRDSDAILFWSAAGIAVRSVAPFLTHKSLDPAVLVLDEQGEYCISLLSGHAGGANELAGRVAEMTGAHPVVTTGTDREHRFSVDEFARVNRLVVTDWERAKQISAKVLRGEMLTIRSEMAKEQFHRTEGMEMLRWISGEETGETADVVITPYTDEPGEALVLIPAVITVGIGCRIGAGEETIRHGLDEFLARNHLDLRAVEKIASIDRKKEEPGLCLLAEHLGIPLVTFSAEELESAEGSFSSSDFVHSVTGTGNVCQRSAVKGAGAGSRCLAEKTVIDGVTYSAARKGSRPGKVSAVGIGPGERDGMTEQAAEAIRSAEIVFGYQTYIRQLRPMFPDKIYRESGMRQERQRIREALEEAAKGRTVAVVSSGDPAVYGMGGLLLEMAEEYPGVDTECIPGVTAALSGSACLGAPLGHDFACISLSDLLTPWETIQNRLEQAAQGDFVLVLYNPSSNSRKPLFEEACRILLTYRAADTVCGWCRNIGREGEQTHLCTLEELSAQPVDMRTTVFVGSSRTRKIGGRMVTPRGYEL